MPNLTDNEICINDHICTTYMQMSFEIKVCVYDNDNNIFLVGHYGKLISYGPRAEII